MKLDLVHVIFSSSALFSLHLSTLNSEPPCDRVVHPLLRSLLCMNHVSAYHRSVYAGEV